MKLILIVLLGAITSFIHLISNNIICKFLGCDYLDKNNNTCIRCGHRK